MKLSLLAAFGLLLPQVLEAGEVIRLKSVGNLKPQQLIASQKSEGLFLLQWKNAVREDEKKTVKNLGIELMQYFPDDAFLVEATQGQMQAAAELSFISAYVAYDAAMKLEPELSANGVFSFGNVVKVSIQLKNNAREEEVKNLLTNTTLVGNGLIVGEASVGELWNIAKREDVLWIERYLEMQTFDMKIDGEKLTTATQTGYESGVRVMKPDSTYARGLTGAGQIVAFADTGLDTGDLSTLLADFHGQVKGGFAVGLGGNSWGDPQNHGTHVAGSIAGSGVSSNQLIRGTGFGAKLVAQGMWSDMMNNIMPPTIPKLFEGAYKEGARIHSDSWGAPNSNGRYDNWAALADGWIFQNPDFLPVFAAGNDGADKNKDGVIDEGSLSSPGSAKNVLTVGASKNFLQEGGIQRKMIELRNGKDKWGVEPIASSMLSEDEKGMAAFSSRGPAADGRIKPEVVAPGTNIVSARSKHPNAKPENSWGVYDDNYLYMGGTSMATPLTAGAMAVVRQMLVQKLGTESISAALMKATISNTAEDLFPGQFGFRSSGQEQPTARPNNHQGWGRVNLENLSGANLTALDQRVGLKTGEAYSTKVMKGANSLKITLAYTDAPASANAAKTLVNNLDLVVVGPGGEQYFPNGKTSADSVNNMEQIDIANGSGSFEVKVLGTNIPQGKNGAQPFALVISQ
jgi:serine protease AprX